MTARLTENVIARHCNKCGVEKRAVEFGYRTSTRVDGTAILHAICRGCRSARYKAAPKPWVMHLEAVSARYLAGESIPMLADEFGLSARTLYRQLKRGGLDIRATGDTLRLIHTAKVQTLPDRLCSQCGLTLSAARFGSRLALNTVCKRCVARLNGARWIAVHPHYARTYRSRFSQRLAERSAEYYRMNKSRWVLTEDQRALKRLRGQFQTEMLSDSYVTLTLKLPRRFANPLISAKRAQLQLHRELRKRTKP